MFIFANTSSAFRIFSVLNDRGLNLLPTDILKSDVIGKVPAAKQDVYTDKWEEIEDDLAARKRPLREIGKVLELVSA